MHYPRCQVEEQSEKYIHLGEQIIDKQYLKQYRDTDDAIQGVNSV